MTFYFSDLRKTEICCCLKHLQNCLNPTAKIWTVLNSKAFFSCWSFLALEILCVVNQSPYSWKPLGQEFTSFSPLNNISRNLTLLLPAIRHHTTILTIHLEHLHIKMRQVKLSFTPPEESSHIFTWPNSGIRCCNGRKNTQSFSVLLILVYLTMLSIRNIIMYHQIMGWLIHDILETFW